MITLLERIIPAPRRVMPVKASFGLGQNMLTYDTPLSAVMRSPQKMMAAAQEVYRTNRHVRTAERVISTRFATVPWHLEDENDLEIDDEHTSVAHKAIRALIEHPYRPAPGDPVSATPRTRAQLWGLTCRHMGICGQGYWYLDQTEALAGTPLQLLYINPARMWPVEDDAGALIGWVMDKDSRHPVPLEKESVLAFHLEPPDAGHLAAGLVETAMTMVDLTKYTDRYANQTMASGGRLAGIFGPSGDDVIAPETYDQLVADLRAVAESPDAARRALVLKGPMTYTQTSGTPADLNALEMMGMACDEVSELWGVPRSQFGGAGAEGMNSGASKGFDAEVLWMNAVGPRLRSFTETLQYELLDRYKALGITIEMEIEEPVFSDKWPEVEIADKAKSLPLRNVERRALMGLEPFGDPSLDNAVWIDGNVISLAMAPDEETGVMPPELPVMQLIRRQAIEDATTPDVAVTGNPTVPSNGMAPRMAVMKADVPGLAQLRDEQVAGMKRDLAAFLAGAADHYAERVTSHAEHVTRKPGDTSVWWDAEWFDANLTRVLRPHLHTIAGTAAGRVDMRFAGKASLESIFPRLMARVGVRIKDIGRVTRERIAEVIEQGIRDGLGMAELGKAIRESTAFDELRAETIARTETAVALNTAAIESYREYDVSEVEVSDGDVDDPCAEANGSIWSLTEALDNPISHPNCTRDFAPLIGAPAKAGDEYTFPNVAAQALGTKLKALSEDLDDMGTTIRFAPTINVHMPEQQALPAPIVNVAAAEAPVVNVAAPVVNVAAPVVHMPEGKALTAQHIIIDEMPAATQVVKRDQSGRITEIVER